MIDPEIARASLREYYATASDQQVVDDVRRFSPELSTRLGIDAAPVARSNLPRQRGIRGLFAAVGRSVLKIFS